MRIRHGRRPAGRGLYPDPGPATPRQARLRPPRRPRRSRRTGRGRCEGWSAPGAAREARPPRAGPAAGPPTMARRRQPRSAAPRRERVGAGAEVVEPIGGAPQGSASTPVWCRPWWSRSASTPRVSRPPRAPAGFGLDTRVSAAPQPLFGHPRAAPAIGGAFGQPPTMASDRPASAVPLRGTAPRRSKSARAPRVSRPPQGPEGFSFDTRGGATQTRWPGPPAAPQPPARSAAPHRRSAVRLPSTPGGDTTGRWRPAAVRRLPSAWSAGVPCSGDSRCTT